MSVSNMPLSQFRPANFTGLPDSHQPAAWAPALANTLAENNVASRVLFIFIVVTLPILKWITAVSRHPALSTSHQACAASPFVVGIAPCSTGRISRSGIALFHFFAAQ